ncbi:hypothetical protein [Streptomyces sp. NPDC056948]|uniref:hypothetical protein n=1 Tax=Streptomyces sp. NPDC056948 TaxID=3345975 RepID=UPI003628C389
MAIATSEYADPGFEPLEDPPPEQRWREADAAVVLVTGHGVTSNGAHWTVLQGSEADRLSSTSLRTADLISWLKDTRIRHLFLVLDQCFAGQTIAERPPSTKPCPAPGWCCPAPPRTRKQSREL